MVIREDVRELVKEIVEMVRTDGAGAIVGDEALIEAVVEKISVYTHGCVSVAVWESEQAREWLESEED